MLDEAIERKAFEDSLKAAAAAGMFRYGMYAKYYEMKCSTLQSLALTISTSAFFCWAS